MPDTTQLPNDKATNLNRSHLVRTEYGEQASSLLDAVARHSPSRGCEVVVCVVRRGGVRRVRARRRLVAEVLGRYETRLVPFYYKHCVLGTVV